jgi:hypothetical protein
VILESKKARNIESESRKMIAQELKSWAIRSYKKLRRLARLADNQRRGVGIPYEGNRKVESR